MTGETEPAGSVTGRVRDAATRLAAELAGTGSPLAAVTAARELADAADAAMQASVDRARSAGHSWREIGDVLGTTRQAAFQRFGRPVDPRTGRPMVKPARPGLADRATEIIGMLADGRWEDVRQLFGPDTRERLAAGELARGWAQTVGLVGSLERTGPPALYELGDLVIADVPLSFEAGERTGRISFTPDGALAGLFIRPPGG